MEAYEVEEITGYKMCLFPPKRGETCEECDADEVQLYFGDADFFDGREGKYKCLSCLRRFAVEINAPEQRQGTQPADFDGCQNSNGGRV